MAIEMLTRSLLSHSCMCVCAQFIPDVYVVFLWSFPPHAHASLVFPADFELAFVFFLCIGLSPSHTLIKSSKCISLNFTQPDEYFDSWSIAANNFLCLSARRMNRVISGIIPVRRFICFSQWHACGQLQYMLSSIWFLVLWIMKRPKWPGNWHRSSVSIWFYNELPRRLLPIRTGI